LQARKFDQNQRVATPSGGQQYDDSCKPKKILSGATSSDCQQSDDADKPKNDIIGAQGHRMDNIVICLASQKMM
jgi:hypothetical protein